MFIKCFIVQKFSEFQLIDLFMGPTGSGGPILNMKHS